MPEQALPRNAGMVASRAGHAESMPPAWPPAPGVMAKACSAWTPGGCWRWIVEPYCRARCGQGRASAQNTD